MTLSRLNVGGGSAIGMGWPDLDRAFAQIAASVERIFGASHPN